MLSGQGFRPDSPEVVSAQLSVARSAAALSGFLAALERLGECLVASTETLERREAVIAADEAAGLLCLAADALRDGSARLALIEDGDLIDELLILKAEARACSLR